MTDWHSLVRGGLSYHILYTVFLICAQLGKRIVDLQTSLGLLHNDSNSGPVSHPEDSFGREPFHHPALSSLSQLTEDVIKVNKSKRRIAEVAERYGLLDVLRWKPKTVSSLY